MSFRIRSIKAKLVLVFLIAMGPMLVAELYEHVSLRIHERYGMADIAASLAGLMVIYVMGNRLTRPLRRLTHAAKALAVCDYRRRVNLSTGDELEALAESFNALGESLMNHEIREKRQAEMLAGMVEASRIASSFLDLPQCAKAVADVMCTHLGASSTAVFRRNLDDGGMKVVGYRGKRPRQEWTRLAAHAADSGEYLMISEVFSASGSAPGKSAFLVGIPLSTGAQRLGAIVARFTGDLTKDDLRLGSLRADVLRAFGVHAAAAVENALVHSETARYSEVLEDWVEHLSSVMQVTDEISPSLNMDETLAALARATAAVLEADECVIFLSDGDGSLTATHCCNPEQNAVLDVKLIPDKSQIGKAFARKKYMACTDMSKISDQDSVRLAETLGMRGLLSTPLIVEDRVIGVIAVCSRNPRRFTPGEIRLLTSIGIHAAVTVRNADLYTKKSTVAEVLQADLISEAPESCCGLRFASRYIPATDYARVGGDFYDVTPLPNGKVGVVMADVSGKGLKAAIHLAACKYMMKSLSYAHPDDPAAVLGKLNEAINHCFDLTFFVTMFYGIIDPPSRTMDYASAGHPPAILIAEGGKMHTCLSTGGIPVGSGYPCDYEWRSARLEPSDILLLYTDGVLEIALAGDMLGLDGLHKLIFKAGRSSASELIDYLCDRLVDSTQRAQRDDMALFAISLEDAPTATDWVAGGLGERPSKISIGTS